MLPLKRADHLPKRIRPLEKYLQRGTPLAIEIRLCEKHRVSVETGG